MKKAVLQKEMTLLEELLNAADQDVDRYGALINIAKLVEAEQNRISQKEYASLTNIMEAILSQLAFVTFDRYADRLKIQVIHNTTREIMCEIKLLLIGSHVILQHCLFF